MLATLPILVFVAALVLLGTRSPHRRSLRLKLLLLISALATMYAAVAYVPYARRQRIFDAVRAGDAAQVRRLIADTPTCVQSTTITGHTPLHVAAEVGDEQIALMLLSAGASANAEAESHVTPLHIAAQHGRYQVAKVLLDAGAHVSAVGCRHGDTPLHVAVMHNYPHLVELLLSRGADPYARSALDQTPMSLARDRGHSEVLSVLTKPSQERP